MRPHPAFVEFVKRYNNSLDVEYNPHWVEMEDPGTMFVVVQKVTFTKDLGNGAYSLVTESFPVLWIPQASEIDHRVIRALEESRLDRQKKVSYWEERERQNAEAEKLADDGMTDETHFHFKRMMSGINLSNYKEKNPYDETKKLQDKLGRELR